MAIQDVQKETESTTAVISELRKQTSNQGINIIKEYKDIFSTEDSSGSDRKNDKVTDKDDALSLLKTLIEETKASIAKEEKKKKWEFDTSPHVQFEKTIDDTYNAFLAWARVKEDKSKVNVSKAFRRLEAYADWMHDTGTDLSEPALTPDSVKKALDAWKFSSSIDSEGRLVWWLDIAQMDIQIIKKEFKPEDHLRAFVWYSHALMYNKAAQENGMVVIENLAKIGMIDCFTFMPAKLSTKLDRLTIGVLPIKMQCCYMFESPTWMNVFMKIVGMFMSKKMKERLVFLKSWDEIDKIGGLEAIPKGFGKVDGKMEKSESIIEKQFFG